MKLFVDDIRQAPDDSWTVARNVTEAIRAIARFGNDIKEISLDHDISHQVHIEKLSRPFPCGECFCPVAYYIGSYFQVGEDSPQMTIHTANPAGAKEMEAILHDHDINCKIKMMGLANRLEMEFN